MDRYEISEAFAAMWRQSRMDAGKSQEYVAKKLGVSKKTVQNWECGIGSPSQMKGFEWFQALELQPLPYYLRLLYPSEFSSLDDELQTKNALILYITSQPPAQQKKLLYFLCGDHGSAHEGVMEMLTAYLHTPLKDRINIASSIINNYDIAEANGQLVNPDHDCPDMALLKESFHNSKDAVFGGRHSYTNFKR